MNLLSLMLQVLTPRTGVVLIWLGTEIRPLRFETFRVSAYLISVPYLRLVLVWIWRELPVVCMRDILLDVTASIILG